MFQGETYGNKGGTVSYLIRSKMLDRQYLGYLYATPKSEVLAL